MNLLEILAIVVLWMLYGFFKNRLSQTQKPKTSPKSRPALSEERERVPEAPRRAAEAETSDSPQRTALRAAASEDESTGKAGTGSVSRERGSDREHPLAALLEEEGIIRSDRLLAGVIMSEVLRPPRSLRRRH